MFQRMAPLQLKLFLYQCGAAIEQLVCSQSPLRSFLTFALCILTAHNLWRHSRALVHVHIENIADLP